MDDFLKIEYERCLDLAKFYDERQFSLLKVTAALSSGVISALTAIHALGDPFTAAFWHLAAFVSGITSLGLAALFVGMLQTRLYFIYPVRQVNAIRKHLLNKAAGGFNDNQMYLDTSFPAFKMGSAHSVMIGLAALQVSTFLAFVIFAVAITYLELLITTLLCLVVAVLGAILLFAGAAGYLRERGTLPADSGIHNQKGN
jgi:hypothetical protein